MDSTAVTTWLAVLTGGLTIAGSVYGFVVNMTQRRMDASRRLNDAAAVAVRRTEGAVVRPLLRDRLQDAIVDHAAAAMATRGMDGGPHADEDRFVARMKLFVELQRRMSLTEAEKNEAHRAAVSNLVTQLRLSPHPPIPVKTERDLEQHAVRLSELIESAYNQRPRPGGDMIRSLAEFCNGTGDNAMNRHHHHYDTVEMPAPPVTPSHGDSASGWAVV